MQKEEFAYQSGRLPKIKGVQRGYVRGKAYIFAINSGTNEYSLDNRRKIVIELHSSVTLNAANRGTWYKPRASTEITLGMDEARHLLSALLAAMEKASKEGNA